MLVCHFLSINQKCHLIESSYLLQLLFGFASQPDLSSPVPVEVIVKFPAIVVRTPAIPRVAVWLAQFHVKLPNVWFRFTGNALVTPVNWQVEFGFHVALRFAVLFVFACTTRRLKPLLLRPLRQRTSVRESPRDIRSVPAPSWRVNVTPLFMTNVAPAFTWS